MALIRVRPTRFDRVVAGEVSTHTTPAIEDAAKVLTWGADEHVMLLAATAFWLCCRKAPTKQRRVGNHVLICSLAAWVLPHVLKNFIDQERPDRRTSIGHWRGVPWSGNRFDAFPSGHAVHVGALASAATMLPGRFRAVVWSVGGILAATRVVLLAHWPTDVIAGLGLGVLLERLTRRLTLKPGRNRCGAANVMSGRAGASLRKGAYYAERSDR